MIPVSWTVGVACGAIAIGFMGGYRVKTLLVKEDEARAQASAIRERDLASQADSRTALALTVLRGDMARHAGVIQAQIDQRPLSKEIRYVVDGKEVTCNERDAVAYRRLHNAAITGTSPTSLVPGTVPGEHVPPP